MYRVQLLKLPPKSKNDVNEAPIVSDEPIDFSKVEIEPLFADFVDFGTFCKSDFRAVKVKECEAVKKVQESLKVHSGRWYRG